MKLLCSHDTKQVFYSFFSTRSFNFPWFAGLEVLKIEANLGVNCQAVPLMTFCICMSFSKAQIIVLEPQLLLHVEFQMFQSGLRFSLPKAAEVDPACYLLHLLLFLRNILNSCLPLIVATVMYFVFFMANCMYAFCWTICTAFVNLRFLYARIC